MTKPIPRTTMLVDTASLLFRVAAVQKNNPFNAGLTSEDMVGLCMHVSMQSVFKWYNKLRPDFVVFAFEGGKNWRREFTSVNQSRREYKANRVYDPAMKYFYEMMDAFYETMSAHTSICCLKVEGMEGDDVISQYCQTHATPETEITIVSGDKDFIQLLKLPGVKLMDPDSGKLRNQPGDKNYQEDLDYWLFLKCIRGDLGDNVPSAFPRVRETKVQKAYANDYDRANLMNEVWRDENDNVHRVGDLYEENVTLLSLFDQPPEVKQKLSEGVEAQVNGLGNYSHFHFLRFCESFNLTRVREDAMKFVDMLANNQRFLKGEKKVSEPKLTIAEKVAMAKEKDAERRAAERAAPGNKLMEF